MKQSLLLLFSIIFLISCSRKGNEYKEFDLNSQWEIQSSAIVGKKGEDISKTGYICKDWYSCNIPSTVFSALVANGEYGEPYFNNNLEKINPERFNSSWWYRKEFIIDNLNEDQFYSLGLLGLNYRANIWLNGILIAKADTIESPFRIFNIPLTVEKFHKSNVLAIEVFPPKLTDLTIGFVDWNPPAPDNNMGLWRGVKLTQTGMISLTDVIIRSEIDTNTLKSAQLNIGFKLTNHSSFPKIVKVNATIEGITLEKEFEIGSDKTIYGEFNPNDYKELNIQNPRLWWPNGMGKPELYTLDINTSIDGYKTQQKSIRFGIRTVDQFWTKDKHKGFKINGKPVLIKGSGWVDDLTLSDSDEKVKAQIEYVRHMNLNTIRMEGFWGNTEKIYDYADENGILVMLGWSCHWEWEHYCNRPEKDFMCINPDEYALQTKAYVDQVKWLRNHPSVFLWVLGSDKLPPTELEVMLNAGIKKEDPTRPILASCKYYDADDIFNNTSKISGPTGVKMRGPYDYVTPNYWFVDKKYGGAFGFNTETGPGPQVPPLESLVKMIPQDSLWPPTNYSWNFHCGRHEFHTLNNFLKAFNARYGESKDIEDFSSMSQVSNYEAIRPMYEAFEANKFKATGVIQWMLNSAWPEMYWQQYDWYLMPNGAFYGTKSACRPLNILYNYEKKSAFVSSDLIEPQQNLRAEFSVFDVSSKSILKKTISLNIGANESKEVFDLSKITGLTSVYFVDMRLYKQDSLVAINFYWLSTKDDVLDYKNNEWYVTPNSQYADLKGLRTLDKVKVDSKVEFSSTGDKQFARVILKNASDKIAFFLDLSIKGSSSKKTVLPIFWEDNYISLLPRESRAITVWFYTKDVKGESPVFEMNGINLSK